MGKDLRMAPKYPNGYERIKRSPGVYVYSSTPRAEMTVATGIPLFVGFGDCIDQGYSWKTSIGKINLYEVGGFDHFEKCIEVNKDGVLDYAVRGFFENGGERCLVAPILDKQEGSEKLNLLTNLFSPESTSSCGSSLLDIQGIDLVCAPDIQMQEYLSPHLEDLTGQQKMLSYCKKMENRFAILDGPRDLSSPEQEGLLDHELLVGQLQKLPERGRKVEGAIYFPWIYVKSFERDERMGRAHVAVPPCGHIAGIYARSDAAFGVHKAPANEVIEGAIDLTVHVSGRKLEELSNAGVNCLVSIPGRGIRLWGGRTLSTQPSWKYINVRRLFITLLRWIEQNMSDVVFEPNDPALWDRVRDKVHGYCFELFRCGALKGNRPSEAFFVKCDRETNTLESIESGHLICEIGLAPLVPAEFIVVRIEQSSTGTSDIPITLI